MTIFQWIIPALWLLFLVYWAVSAIGAKRSLGTSAWWKQSLLRGGIVVLTLAAIHFAGAGHALRAAQVYQARSVLLGAIGALLVLLGVGLAIFARVYLGRNWGMPMSRKAEPELVTRGPYAFVRHPIYTGLIMGAVAMAALQAKPWAIAGAALFSLGFTLKARVEERFLEKEIGGYDAYRRRVAMILPLPKIPLRSLL